MSSLVELIAINHKKRTQNNYTEFILCLRILGTIRRPKRKTSLGVQVKSKQESTNESSY